MINHVLSGVVDSVKAVRQSGTDEVLHLRATIHFDASKEFTNTYGGGVTMDWDLPIPVDSGINPGDVVSVELSILSPFGQRFAPALTVGDPRDEGFDEDREAELA